MSHPGASKRQKELARQEKRRLKEERREQRRKEKADQPEGVLAVNPGEDPADHAGFPFKAQVKARLNEQGHEVLDLGTVSTAPVDYPDFAEAVGEALAASRAERGILICGSGVGVCVAANKIPGVRAGICHDCYSAHQGVEHDDINVLCLGARIVGPELMREIVDAFISARFSGEERHVRRLSKTKAIELKYLRGR